LIQHIQLPIQYAYHGKHTVSEIWRDIRWSRWIFQPYFGLRQSLWHQRSW